MRCRRLLDTLLVMLFVFRLVLAPDRSGYATVAGELWDQCRRLGGASCPAPRCRVRLLRYSVGGTTFFLASSLLDRKRYRRQDLANLYHARWGIEELDKTAKQDLRPEQFRGRSERLVKQELYANGTLVALTQLFANRSERDARVEPEGHGRPA